MMTTVRSRQFLPMASGPSLQNLHKFIVRRCRTLQPGSRPPHILPDIFFRTAFRRTCRVLQHGIVLTQKSGGR